jgi:hypothetical protein
VGAEAACSVTFGRKTSDGEALLESSEIIFRGDFRLVISLARISALDASGGKLSVTFPDGTAVFDLGPQAEKWAAKIRSPKTVIDKLDVKPGQRAVVLNVRDDGLASQLRERGVAVSARVAKDADVIFIGAETLAELSGLRQLVARIKRDGAIWTITPKGKGGIKDTDIMGVAKAAGLVALKVVSFSDTHSANKFVIPKAAR